MKHDSIAAALTLLLTLAACGESIAPADGPASLEIVDGDDQQALIFTALPDPLRVRVLDRGGDPVEGVTVQWSANGGTVSPAAVVTDAEGMAAATWSFGVVPGTFTAGTYQATASVAGLSPVTFTGHARVGSEIADVEIDPASVDVATGPADVTVTVRATDDYGQLISIDIEFTSPSAAQTSGSVALDLVSGSTADGVWTGTVTIPQGAEPGVWSVARLRLVSTYGILIANAAALELRDLPHEIIVIP
jgi:hypothetical protein